MLTGLRAGITLWGRDDHDYLGFIQPLTVYLSMSPNFVLGYACVVNAMSPLTTGKRPWTIVCNSTVQDAQVHSVFA